MARGCLDDETVCALIAQNAPDLEEIVAHLDACVSCRSLVAAMLRGTPLSRAPSRPNLPKARVAVPEAARSESALETRLVRGAIVAEKYALASWIGAGASGSVWAAVEIGTSRRVALKVLRATSPNAVKRMHREADIVMALRHPHIVRVHGVLEETPWGPIVVMDLLEGETLETRLVKHGSPSLAWVSSLTVQILTALEAAHARGIVHRDLKPQNVFLSATTDDHLDAKLLDFGMAKLLDGTPASRTTTGVVLGTPLYMAPEQLFADPDVDGRADLYSVGVLVVRAITGRVPIEGRSLGDIVKWHASGASPRFEADVPADIRATVEAMLANDREQRPASIEPALRVFRAHAIERA